LLSALLLVGAALFAVGIRLERNASDSHDATTTSETPAAHVEGATEEGSSEEAGHSETGHSKTGHSKTGHSKTGHSKTGHSETGHSEGTAKTVLGLNLESNVLVVGGIVLSLALALLALQTARRSTLIAVGTFAALFMVFDIAEVRHQLNNSHIGIAVIAAAVAAVHLCAVVLSWQRATSRA
jgi:hypothetical protein